MFAGLAFCETPSQYLRSAFPGLSGGPQRGQQQSATQTLRVHLLGIDNPDRKFQSCLEDVIPIENFIGPFLAGALYREFLEFMRILTTFLGKTHRNPS